MKDEREVVYDHETKERYQREQLRMEAGQDAVKGRGDAGEEFAAEIAEPVRAKKISYAEPAASLRGERGFSTVEREEEEEHSSRGQSRTLGLVALLLAVLSLFVWPALLGPAAVVLGVVSFIKGSRALGAWSVALGLVTIAVNYVLVPIYT